MTLSMLCRFAAISQRMDTADSAMPSFLFSADACVLLLLLTGCNFKGFAGCSAICLTSPSDLTGTVILSSVVPADLFSEAPSAIKKSAPGSALLTVCR